MDIRGLIFDFDGVIADSEALANNVLAETISQMGLQTSLDDALARYMGKRWPEVVAAIERDTGRKTPDDFAESLKQATLACFRTSLREVEGASDFIRHFGHLPRCIASSSSADRLEISLAILGLTDTFGSHVYSADRVSQGKPHPGIFLLAAGQIGVPPAYCAVIEDSISGVQAGVAAGMIVIGLCAGSHMRAGHAGRLQAAGAHHVAASWNEIRNLMR